MAEQDVFYFDRIKSPIGDVVIVAGREGAMRILYFDDSDDRWRHEFERRHAGGKLVAKRDPSGHSTNLRAYFGGDMEALDRIPVDFDGTPFQNKVWKALCKIPVGRTTSYGALAKKIGEPQAVRAVGLANGSNPISLVVPCHRVIGSDGSLTGYGGGLPRKKWLLEHEARHCGAQFELEAST
ncbi:MAG TPA: methylated-DNA--[protein]-cysteine S-methyltransferase [Rhizomicrobium sp.]|jgi:methylated-DNA-[protein]-cysteine S-methyltransferase|nr:methylated-DNA--[protein]-cysteine S-methyltransferase [Rhizomicrobium sp.]